jgi:hypothetical protein
VNSVTISWGAALLRWPLAAAAVLALASAGGAAGLVALGAGMLLLDVCVQCGHVADQPSARWSVSSARNRSGWSRCGPWPASSMTTSR